MPPVSIVHNYKPTTSGEVATVDAIMNDLNDAREAAGLRKAELARAVSANPAVVRRLFSTADVSPTLGTLARVAAALGLRITVEPMDDEDLVTQVRGWARGELNHLPRYFCVPHNAVNCGNTSS
jgi:ribosome-binding protein aMBF1 (putative translation factor)